MSILLFMLSQKLPKIDGMFDSSKLNREVIRSKSTVLWRALHRKTLDLSDISLSDGGPSSEGGFERANSASTVAHALGRPSAELVDDSATHMGLDFLGAAWQYTHRLGTLMTDNPNVRIVGCVYSHRSGHVRGAGADACGNVCVLKCGAVLFERCVVWATAQRGSR